MPDERPKNCPPDDAMPTAQTFLRFASGELAEGARPPISDWLYPYEQPKSAYFGRVDDCRCHAHSVFADPEDVQRARRLVPIFKSKRVARVVVGLEDGVVKHTPAGIGQSHHSWWPAPTDLWPEATVVP